jgi:hypothetical protein
VELYWEGWQTEPVSPELALVDPVLRARLLARPRLGGSTLVVPSVDWIGQPPVLPASAIPEPARGEAATDGRQVRRSDVIAWTSFTAACGTALALVVLAHSQHARRIHVPQPLGPVVALVTTHSPPAAPLEQRTEAEKRRLAILLRSPMRDPFSPASSGR